MYCYFTGDFKPIPRRVRLFCEPQKIQKRNNAQIWIYYMLRASIMPNRRDQWEYPRKMERLAFSDKKGANQEESDYDHYLRLFRTRYISEQK